MIYNNVSSFRRTRIFHKINQAADMPVILALPKSVPPAYRKDNAEIGSFFVGAFLGVILSALVWALLYVCVIK